MTKIEKVEGKWRIEIVGWDKVWSFKSMMEFPVEHVVSARKWDETMAGGWRGFRAPGTNMPGVIVAGTYHRNHEHVFYDVHDFSKAIVIELRDEWYARLIIEVADPDATLRQMPNGLALAP